MGIADLPDIDEDEWLAYQADTFSRQTKPLGESAAFMAATVPFLNRVEQRASEAVLTPPPPPPMNLGAPPPMGGLGVDGVDGTAPAFPSPYFGGQQSTTSDLFDELTSFDGDEDAPAYKTSDSTPTQTEKPGFFSWAGQQLGGLADAAKTNPLLQSGQGRFAAGAVRGLSDVAHSLGGSAEALRQGDILGGVAGAARAALSPGDVLRGAAREMELPEQILPNIQPDTPVLGGLNNPRELAGLVPELLIPATALERAVGGVAGRVAKPIASRIGEVASPLVDRALSAGRRAFGEVAEAPLGITSSREGGTAGRFKHGTRFVFDQVDPERVGGEQNLYGPGYYLSDNDAVVNSYAQRRSGDIYGRERELEDLQRQLQEAQERGDGRRVMLALGEINRLQSEIQRAGAPNVRQVDVPEGLRLLDADNAVPGPEVARVSQVVERYGFDPYDFENRVLRYRQARMADPDASRSRSALDAVNGDDLHAALTEMLASRPVGELPQGMAGANRILSEAGFDGITHEGGKLMPLADAAGNPVSHRVNIIFPDKLDQVRNALSGTPGGVTARALESPFFSPARTGAQALSDIGMGTAGGIAGAATADEDATWQERAGRFAAGAAIGAMGGPIARAPSGIGGVLRKLSGGEDEAFGVAGRRGPRQGIPDFGDLREPISPEEWEAMTPRQRRNARDAADAGRAYRPVASTEITRRAQMREAEKLQEEVATELPELTPSDDTLPPAESASDVLSRTVSTMSSAAQQKVLSQASGQTMQRNAPYMRGLVEQTFQNAPEGGTARYDEILKLTTGQDSVGQLVESALDDVATQAPPLRMTKRMRQRLGNLQSMENVPEFLQEQLQRERDTSIRQAVIAHGGRTTKDSEEAAQAIMEYIGQFAKHARPNEPVNEAMLRAGREARASAQWPKYIAIDEYEKALADPNASEETKEIARQAMEYWDSLSRVLTMYAGETAPSEVARAFRSMRDKPVGAMRVGGGAPKPGEALPSGELAPGKNVAKLTPEERAYQDRLSQQRKDLQGKVDLSPAGQATRTRNRVAGKRPNGPMEDLGLEWSDIFARDPDDTLQRAKMMAGLEDMGGYRMRRDWTPRLQQIDLDDAEAVKQFWTDARTAAGLDENNMPLVDFNPEITGQSYLGAADTITRADALNLVNRTLIRDADAAYKALRQAKLAGATREELTRLQDEASAAYARIGLDVTEFPEEGVPILAKVVESLSGRIEREWPEDRIASPDSPGYAEAVAKKRQLLGLFDQAIKKEQKFAGMPVTGIQDLLSIGTSNVLMTARYVQSAGLESLWNMINAPLENLIRGASFDPTRRQKYWGEAGQQFLGIRRAFGLPTSEDLLKLGEGLKWPAVSNAMSTLEKINLGSTAGDVAESAPGIGPMQSAGELRDIATRRGHIMSDSPGGLAKFAVMHKVGRFLSEAFQTGSYFGEVARLAKEASENGTLPGGKRIAKILGDDGEFRYPTMAELYGNLPQEIVDEALKTSKKITEGGEADVIEKNFGQWKGLLNKPGATSSERALGVFANLMFPFVYGLRPAIHGGVATITGPVRYPVKAARAWFRGDKGEAGYMAKKAALATAFDSMIAWNVMAGNITGHGPSDAGARQAMMEATDENGDPVWRPDSIRVRSPGGGNFWVKYTSMPGAVSMVASILANGYESWAYDGKPMESVTDSMQRISPQLIAATLDNTYFRDAIDLATSLNSTGGTNTITRLASQMIGRAIPGPIRTAAQLTDPYQRIAQGPFEPVMANIPGLRQMLPAQVSPYTGNPVEMGVNPLTALGGLSGNIYSSPSEQARSPVAREVMEASRRVAPWQGERPTDVRDASGQRPTVTPRTFTRGEQIRGAEYQGLEQTGAALRGAQAAYGASTAENLLPLITSPEYMALPPEQKAQRLSAAMKASTAQAEYAATGAPGIQLRPDTQVDRDLMGRPMFRGQDEGSPSENAALNQRIISAQNALAQLTQRYGRRAAIIMMDEKAPEMLELALTYRRYNPDVRWLQEQESRQSMGIPLAPPTDVFIPDYGGGAGTTIPGRTDGVSAQSLPPGLRRILG